MPIYEYRCHNGIVTEAFAHMHETREETVTCQEGGHEAHRIFSLPLTQTFQPRFDQHIQPGGAYLTSRRQQKEIMNRRGLVEVSARERLKGMSCMLPNKVNRKVFLPTPPQTASSSPTPT